LYVVDAIYLVALSLGRILVNDEPAQLTNGQLFRRYASNIHFTGVSGSVVLDAVAERQPEYMVRVAHVNGTLENILLIHGVLDENGVAVGGFLV
jgi:hypothetical protein